MDAGLLIIMQQAQNSSTILSDQLYYNWYVSRGGTKSKIEIENDSRQNNITFRDQCLYLLT